MMTPAERLALQHAIRLSAQLEVEIGDRKGTEPIVAILHRARSAAAIALAALANVDPEDPKTIRALQNEVQRFEDMVGWVRAMIAEGLEADRELNDADRIEVQELTGMTPEQRAELARLGLSPSQGNEDA